MLAQLLRRDFELKRMEKLSEGFRERLSGIQAEQ